MIRRATQDDIEAITLERLRELLHYTPETGIFTWRVNRGGMKCAGRAAGATGLRGIVFIRVEYRIYKAHRLAWFYMTGEWPTLIDHINRDASDNRWTNLREANSSQNAWNKGTRPSSTGFRGVSKSGNRFVASIKVKGHPKFLGSFKTAKEAAAAYKKAAFETRGEYAHTEFHPKYKGATL